MATANRIRISDARQKIESAKIAKRVAVKLSQSRARAQVNQSASQWMGRPRLQPRQFNNRKLRLNSVNRIPDQRLRFMPANNASSLVVRKALDGIRRAPRNNFKLQSRIDRRRNFDNFSVTRTNNRVLSINRSRTNNNSVHVQARKQEDNIHMIRRTIRNDRVNVKTSPKNKVVFGGKQANFVARRPGFSTNGSNNNTVKPFIGISKNIEDRREEAMEGVNFVGSANSMAPCSSSSSVFSRLSSGSGVKSNSSQQQQGFKLYVTNLNNAVSDEDIRELFSSVGDLLDSRLTRAGEAYAVFSRLQDANRALSEFNNRELDGIPMKITLANAQKLVENLSPDNSPSIPSQNSKLVHNAKTRLPPSKINEVIEVDRDLITQALFSDANTTNGHKQSPTVQFTVKI